MLLYVCVLPGGNQTLGWTTHIAPLCNSNSRGWHWHHFCLHVSRENPWKSLWKPDHFHIFLPPREAKQDRKKFSLKIPRIICLLQRFCQQMIGKLPSQNICQLPRCSIAITDIPQDAFQLSKVHGCHAIAIVGLFDTTNVTCFFFGKKVSPRGEFWESSKGWVLLWKLVGNQSHFDPRVDEIKCDDVWNGCKI